MLGELARVPKHELSLLTSFSHLCMDRYKHVRSDTSCLIWRRWLLTQEHMTGEQSQTAPFLCKSQRKLRQNRVSRWHARSEMFFDARPLGTKARNNRSTQRGLYKPLQKCYSMQSVPWTGSAERNLWEEALTQIKVSVERDLFLCSSKFPLFPRADQC